MSYHHGNLREAVLEAAKELIAEKGPNGFSLREAARRVGVSHTAVYRHFADRDALLAGVAQQGFEGLGLAFAAAVEGAQDPLSAFAGTGLAYVRFAVDNPSNFRVMFRMAEQKAGYPELCGVSDAAHAVLKDQVAALQRTGLLREGDTELMALAAWSLVHGLAYLLVEDAIDGEELGEPEELARRVTGMLLAGLGTPERATTP